MKILRQKVFFNYKGYAEKYGKEAAKEMHTYRSDMSKDLLRMVKLDRRLNKLNEAHKDIIGPKSKSNIAGETLKIVHEGMNKIKKQHAQRIERLGKMAKKLK